jgi:hypothetical protein
VGAQAEGRSAPPPAPLRALHSISEIYTLPRDQAILGYPVDFEAVVTYSDAEWGMLFVQDKSGHTYINMGVHKANYPLGSRVRVTGATAFSGYALSIAKPKVRFRSTGPEVKPIPKTAEELNTGGYESQLVVTEGVLHPCIEPSDRACFRLLRGKTEIDVDLIAHPSTVTDSLVGATVRARGVASAHLDKDNKRI